MQVRCGKDKSVKPPRCHLLCVRSIEITGRLGGMDVGDSGRSDLHVNQTSVLARSPLSCLAVCLCYHGYRALCVHVCIANREIVSAGRMLFKF